MVVVVVSGEAARGWARSGTVWFRCVEQGWRLFRLLECRVRQRRDEGWKEVERGCGGCTGLRSLAGQGLQMNQHLQGS